MKCRHCKSDVNRKFIDLGASPPSNAYLSVDALSLPEKYFPLRVLVCTNCRLVQTEDFASAEELFNPDYAYFSSISSSWLDHASRYAATITRRLKLGASSFVIEVASNDGYLLRNFVASGIPCLGIEPTKSTATVARSLGIPVQEKFFGAALARELVSAGMAADLIMGNNVYAHVPDLNDFTLGLKIALKPDGVVTLEFPHLMRLIERTQFDTIYHEHFSYLSLNVVKTIFESTGLKVWDVEELSTHGGSLRVYGCHRESSRPTEPTVQQISDAEGQLGLTGDEIYGRFQQAADRIKDNLLMFLIGQKRAGRSVAAYGAAAKGNTLLNYAGIKSDLLPYVCDAAPSKQGKFLPGSRVPILSPDVLRERKPELVLILPWNIAGEVVAEHGYIRSWGGRFHVAVPELREVS